MEGLQLMGEDGLENIGQLVKKLHTNLSGVNTDKIKGKKKQQKKPQRVTDEQKFQAMIAKMKLNLEKYEADANIDNWEIDFPTPSYYGNKTFEELKEIHGRLLKVEDAAEKTKLLSRLERGRMYEFIKISDRFQIGRRPVRNWTSAEEQLIGMIFDGMILDVLLLFFCFKRSITLFKLCFIRLLSCSGFSAIAAFLN